MKQIVEKLRGKGRGAKPQFVIEHEGRLFVTRALVEIDPGSRELGKRARRGIEEVQHRLREEESRARAARYHPGCGSSAVDKLLGGTIETLSQMSEMDDGTSFAATEPVNQ